MKKIINNRAFTLIELLVVITIIAILAGISLPVFSKVQEKAQITKAVSNVKQVGLALRIYSQDYDGKYPDTGSPDAASITTSNDVMRELVIEGIVDNEAIFGAPISVDGDPDGDLGTSPDYTEAASGGENHWEMAANLVDTSNGSWPLLWEDSGDAPATNPEWNALRGGELVAGRTWASGRVVVLTNDSSATTYPVESRDSETTTLREGENVFTIDKAAAGTAVLSAEPLDNEPGA